MKKKKSKLWGALLLPVIIGLLVNWLTPINVPALIWKVLKWFFSLFIVKFTLPVWAILLLMSAIPLVCLVVFLFSLKNSDSCSDVLSYISDTFYGIEWHWRYNGSQVDEYYLTPRCMRCSCVLTPVDESS